MYLVYFRFDDNGQVVTVHVRCSSHRWMHMVFEMAQRRGLTATARLTEWAIFAASTVIIYRGATIPSQHWHTAETFMEAWTQVELLAEEGRRP